MKKITLFLLAAVLILSMAACGGGNSDTPTTTQGATETPVATPTETENVKGTRSNPYQFGDDITVITTGYDGITATYTFNFSEFFIRENEWGSTVEYTPAISGIFSVACDDTDGRIEKQLGYNLFTDGMVRYDLWERHNDGDPYLSNIINEVFGGVTYDAVFATNMGEIDDPSALTFSYLSINGFNSTIDSTSEIWISLPEITVDAGTEADETLGFSQQETLEIDAQLQGTWTVNAAGAEPVYVFDSGNVAVEAIISGVSGGINTGIYEIGKDSLGNGQLTLIFDNGVEGALMFTYKDEKLTLIFTVGDKLYAMGKISDLADTSTLGSFWTIESFVDNFNQPTDERYIVSKRAVQGTFSNSAATNASLEVWPGIATYNDTGEKHVFFILNEYGRNPVNNSSARNDIVYDIEMRSGDGTDQSITGTIWTGGDRICIDGSDMETVIDALMGSGEISFFIAQSDRPTTTYLFKVDTSNFADVHQTLFGNN